MSTVGREVREQEEGQVVGGKAEGRKELGQETQEGCGGWGELMHMHTENSDDSRTNRKGGLLRHHRPLEASWRIAFLKIPFLLELKRWFSS